MIEVTTKYTKESFRKYQWFHTARAGVRKVVFIIFLALMFCEGAALLSLSIIVGRNLATRVFLSLFLLFLPILHILRPRISARLALKKSPALFDAGLTFVFHEDHFTVLTTGMISGTTDIRYEALYRAYQTRDSFYLYPQQRLSYLIDKSSFTVGKPEDLAALLERVMPAKKYRSYVK